MKIIEVINSSEKLNKAMFGSRKVLGKEKKKG